MVSSFSCPQLLTPYGEACAPNLYALKALGLLRSFMAATIHSQQLLSIKGSGDRALLGQTTPANYDRQRVIESDGKCLVINLKRNRAKKDRRHPYTPAQLRGVTGVCLV